jgi:hypothetical protein
MIQRRFPFFGVFFGVMMLWAYPSAAQGALAIGLPARGPSAGFVYGMSVNNANSRTTAMNLCRGIDTNNNAIPDRASEAQSSCKIVGTFHDRCAAAAHNGTKHIPATGVGWAIAATSAAAKNQALANCEAMAKGRGNSACAVEGFRCDGAAN